MNDQEKLSDELINSKNQDDDFMKGFKMDFSRFRSVHRPFGKFKRKIIFFLIFMINVLINIDHGALPAATTILQRELGLDPLHLGAIGSLVYLGLVLGSISAGPIFQSYGSKWVVSISLIVSCFFLYFFTVAGTVFPLALCRIGCGFFQVFCYIYFPVWVDQFGVSASRTLWLTFLQLGVPLGTMVGYVMEAYFVNTHNNVII
jgi:MFS family permease